MKKCFFGLIVLLLTPGSSAVALSSVKTASRGSSHSQLQDVAGEKLGDDPDVEAPPLINALHPTQWFRQRENWGSYVSALFFVVLIGSLPLLLNVLGESVSKVHIAESVCLYVWLFGGLYLFTHVILFQSPHFHGEIRTLDLRESIYFFAQIVTTVGYGDITPARPRGRIFVGVSVLFSISLVAKMMSSVSSMVHTKVEGVLKAGASDETPRNAREEEDHHRRVLWDAFQPVLTAGSIWLSFVVAGTCFFHLAPGEGKTLTEGVYMSMITLSSVGFGVFTPVTKAGMVFASYWMIGGCAALVSTIGAYIAFSDSVKNIELEHKQRALALP